MTRDDTSPSDGVESPREDPVDLPVVSDGPASPTTHATPLPRAGAGPDSPGDGLSKTVDVMGKLGLEALKDAPGHIKWAVGLSVLAMVGLTIASVAVAIRSSGPNSDVVAAALGAGAIIVLVFSIKTLLPSDRSDEKRCDVVVNVRPNDIDEFKALLEEARRFAYSQIKKHARKSELKLKNVRANIFLADTRRSSCTEPFHLAIYPELTSNMTDATELQIRLRCYEGVTGKSYTSGKYCVAIAQGPRDWRGYELSEEQASLVDENLRWILSFPLKRPTDRHILGVLNIDGLNHDIKPEVLEKVLNETALSKIQPTCVLLAKQTTATVRMKVDA